MSKENRNSSVSPERRAVEKFLLSLADGQTVTRQDIRNAISISKQQAMYILSAMRVDGFAVNKAEGQHIGQWCASEKARNPNGKPKGYSPSTRLVLENGDSAYWSKRGGEAMGTPRLTGVGAV